MTNYDLGVAHGRIKIDVDDRGAKQAQTSVTNLETTMRSLDRRMAVMQSSMNRIESHLRNLATEFKRANAEAEALESSMGNLGSTFQQSGGHARGFSTDLRGLTQKMMLLQRTAQTVIPPLQTFQRLLHSFRSSNFNGSFRIFDSIFRSGVAASGIANLTKKMLGFNQAMKNASGWQRAMMKFGSTITAVVGGAGFINFLTRGKLSMTLFAKTAGFAATVVGDLSDSILKLGLKFGSFGLVSSKAFGRVVLGLNSLSKGIVKTFDMTTRLGQGMNKLATGSISVALGFGLMKNGLSSLVGMFTRLGWAGKIAMASIAAIATLGPATLEVFGKALVGTSNLLVGLGNGVKQLAGGFLVLPGAVAMAITAFSALKVVFGGLADAFKDIFDLNDDEAAFDAMIKLQPHLKALGQEFYRLRPQLKEFKTAVQSAFLQGSENQVKALAEIYLPRLKQGMVGVATSAKLVKDRVVEFFTETQTQQDTNKIFGLTSQIFINLANAIKPALAGLRDIAMVGSEFIAQMSAGMPSLMQKFASWAAINRQNGNIMKWISEAWQGVKDLTVGIIDASKAIWKLLTLFANNDGENGLHRFAAAMKRFNDTVQSSAAGGTLKKIGDYVRNLGSESIQKLADVFRSLWDAAKEVIPFFRDMGHYASKVLVPAIKAASQIIEVFFDILNASKIGPILGLISGLATAFGLLWFAVKPVIAVVQTLSGAFIALRGAKKILEGIGDVLYNFGAIGRVAAAGVGFLTTAMTALASVVAILAVAWLAYKTNADYIKSSNELIASSMEKTKKNVQELQKAFVADRGKMGKTTMDQINENVQSNMESIKEQADKAPGIWEHVSNFFSQGGLSNPITLFTTSQSSDFNKSQEILDNAARIKKGFEEVGVSQQEIANAITQGGPAYEELIKKLQGVGENGEWAAGQLALWREEVQRVQQATAALGEGGLAVVDGLEQIATAAGDANQKLNGLRAVLEGLGIIKTTALQATMEYAEGVRNLQQEVQNAIVPGENLADIIDKQTGSFNENSQTASNLLDVLSTLAQDYQNALAAGKNAGDAYAGFESQLDSLASMLGITKDQLKSLAQEAGLFDPKTLQDKVNQFINDPNKKPYLIEFGIDQQKLDDVKKQFPSLFDKAFSGQGNGPHGGYADRAKAAAQAQKDETEKEFKDFAARLTETLNGEAEKANEAGSKFSDALASGMSSNEAAVNAARDMAEKIKKQFHQSPPKEGPLSAHGDAAVYGGKMFVKSYADGISSSLGYVKDASGKVAATVSNGMTSMGAGGSGGAPGSQAGKFFGDLLEIAGFAQRFTSVIQKITDTMFRALKFASDPLGEGTFFGGRLGFRKTVSDDVLRKRREDRLQQDYTRMWDSGSRDLSGYDSTFGMPKIVGPGKLQRDASQSDVQAAIVAEGQRRGLNQEQIVAALAIAGAESNYGQNIYGKGHGAFLPGGGKGDAYGVFQQTPEGGWGTVEQLTDPNYAINKFFDAYQKSLAANADAMTAAILTQNPQLQGRVAGQDYTAAVQNKMAEANKAMQEVLKNGATLPTTSGMFIPGVPSIGGLPSSTILNDQNGIVSSAASQQAAAFVQQMFPRVQAIGGGRATGTAPGTHDKGLAIDVAIPYNAQGQIDKAYGDMVLAALKQNANALNIKYTIWRDVGEYTNGTKFSVGAGTHQDHIDIQFNDGGTANIGPNGTNLKVPFGTSGLMPDSIFGTPNEPGTSQAPPNEKIMVGPDGKLTRVHDGSGEVPGEPWNRLTGKPWTDEERAAFFEQYQKQYDLGEMTLEQVQGLYNDQSYAQGTTDQILENLRGNDAAIASAYDLAANPDKYSEAQTSQILSGLDKSIATRRNSDSPASRYEASQLESLQSNIMDVSGFTRESNPIDTMAGIASNVAGVASDIIGTVTTSLEAVGAADNISKTLVRGMQGTKDVDNVIDNIQKFLELGSKISGSVASVTGLVSSIAGAAGAGSGGSDMGGASAAAAALGSVSTIASLVQAGWETANAVIDLAQEAVRIAGGYVGDFLGYLVGGKGGPLAGDVKFLLDQKTNQLMTYSAENSLDKRIHNVPFAPRDFDSRKQTIGNINVYGGPGSDPRDLTRQMMFQVNSAQYAGALAQ